MVEDCCGCRSSQLQVVEGRYHFEVMDILFESLLYLFNVFPFGDHCSCVFVFFFKVFVNNRGFGPFLVGLDLFVRLALVVVKATVSLIEKCFNLVRVPHSFLLQTIFELILIRNFHKQELIVALNIIFRLRITLLFFVHA